MKKLILLVVIGVSLHCNAQISKESAYQILKTIILNNDWEDKEIFASKEVQQGEENGDGITPQKIYNTLEYHVQSHEDLKQKLIYKYGQEQIINQAFADGGF